MAIKKLVLFDIDGTLLHAKGIGRAAKALAMREVFGVEGTDVANHPFGGKTDYLLLIELLKSYGYGPEAIGAKMALYDRAMGKAMASIAADYPAEPCPGAMELVNTLYRRDDVLIGIVTGNVSTTAPIKLRAGGYDPAWFPIGAFGNESASRDDLPRLAVQRASLYAHVPFSPEDVIVVGDTPTDVEAAHAIGAIAVAVDTGFAEREEIIASQPEYHLPDLTTFFDVVPL